MKKSALLSSAIAFCFSLTMLVGTTYAYWSKTITSENIITAGNLDVTFEAADDLDFTVNYVDLETCDSKILDHKDLAPGQTITRYLRVKNTGTTDVAYRFASIGYSSKWHFNDYVEYSFTKIEDPSQPVGERFDVLVTDYFELKPGHTDIFLVEVNILDTMDNSMQNQFFTFHLALDAKQLLKVQKNPHVVIWPDLDE